MMEEEKKKNTVSVFLSRQFENKKKFIEKFDIDKEIKYFNDCWCYLMEIISKGSTKKSDLFKYKFKKFIVYFVMFFVPIIFATIIFILCALPYLLFNSPDWIYKFLLPFLMILSGIIIIIPFFMFWRIYFVYRQMYKFNICQIFVFENKKYLINFSIETLINLYKDSCVYEKIKVGWFTDFKIGKNKTCLISNLVNIFKYFIKIKNELNKGHSFLDACLSYIF